MPFGFDPAAEKLPANIFGRLTEVVRSPKVKLEDFLNKPVAEAIEEPTLSEDEERLLAAYRQFKNCNKNGSIFKWRINVDTTKILLPEEPKLIQDPQLVVGE